LPYEIIVAVVISLSTGCFSGIFVLIPAVVSAGVFVTGAFFLS
jgi:hypothetical protein